MFEAKKAATLKGGGSWINLDASGVAVGGARIMLGGGTTGTARKAPSPQLPGNADSVEKALGIRKGRPMDYQKAASGANPNFNSGKKEYMMNCQRCVPVYELRRRGYPVTAIPYQEEYNGTPNQCSFGYECFESPQIEGYFKENKNYGIINKKKLLKQLGDLPDGARAGIIGVWPTLLYGHTIVCEKINGKLVFIDPQSGKVDIELEDAEPKYVYSWYRMDNLNLKQDMDWSLVAIPE